MTVTSFRSTRPMRSTGPAAGRRAAPSRLPLVAATSPMAAPLVPPLHLVSDGRLVRALPEVGGAVLVVLLTVVGGFLLASSSDALARRRRSPRAVRVQERSPGLSPILLPGLLLVVVVGLSMLMGVQF